MSATVQELIGNIIHPDQAPTPAPTGPAPVRASAPAASVEALIGRILYPYGEPTTVRAASPAPAPVQRTIAPATLVA